MNSDSPVVLISGGVGVTPMMSMLNTIIHEQPERKVVFIHAAMNSKVHAFREHVKNVAAKHDNVESYVIYQRPTDEDRNASNFDKEGFITLEWMQETLPSKEAQFYFRGPVPFMKAVNSALKQWGVPSEDIHYEFFGSFGDLEAE